MKSQSYNHHSTTTSQTVIFSGSMLAQQPQWQGVTQLLPPKACLLVTGAHSPKLAQVWREVARSYRAKGRLVLVWMPPSEANQFTYQS